MSDPDKFIFAAYYDDCSLTDRETGIAVVWKWGQFNETQKFLTDGANIPPEDLAPTVARLAREMGDYLAENFPEHIVKNPSEDKAAEDFHYLFTVCVTREGNERKVEAKSGCRTDEDVDLLSETFYQILSQKTGDKVETSLVHGVLRYLAENHSDEGVLRLLKIVRDESEPAATIPFPINKTKS